MNYRAIVNCRECGAKDTKDFEVVSIVTFDTADVQNMFDYSVDHECDQCGNNDWKVVEVYELEHG